MALTLHAAEQGSVPDIPRAMPVVIPECTNLKSLLIIKGYSRKVKCNINKTNSIANKRGYCRRKIPLLLSRM